MRRGSSYHLWLLLPVVLTAPACRTPVLSLDDAVVYNGSPTQLAAYAEREVLLGIRTDIAGAAVRFAADTQSLGHARTNDEGRAELETRLPRGTQDITAHVRIGERDLHATGRVFTWSDRRVAVAIDIDHTIADTDLSSLIFGPYDWETDPLPGAREALQALARDYHIVYLTARPRFLIQKTRDWLEKHGFPEGPVHVARGVRIAAKSQEYKIEELRDMRQRWPTLRVGIGNVPGDAAAYAANDMLPVILADPKKKYPPGSVLLPDWPTVAEYFDEHRYELTQRATPEPAQ